MYLVSYFEKIGNGTKIVFNREIPTTNYHFQKENVKNREIKNKVKMLLEQENVYDVWFQKFPLKQNRSINVKSDSGTLHMWEDML